MSGVMFDKFKSHTPKAPAKTKSATGPGARPAAPPSAARPKAAAGAGKPAPDPKAKENAKDRPTELGGPSGPEPTRYGDWERKGICYDF